MTSIVAEQLWIHTPRGKLFAKRWTLPSAVEGSVPIVLFHDSLGCVDLWREFPERLSQVTRRGVVAYDRLGFGRSEPHAGTLNPEFVREEARGSFSALRAQLGISDFIGLGHSVGGGMAIAAASAFPGECRGLITESAQTFVEDRTLQGIRDAQQVFDQPGQLDRLQKYHGSKAEWVLSSWVNTWLAPSFRHWNLDEDLSRIQCALLAIHGDLDEYGSVEHPKRIAEHVRASVSVQILEGCGHVPHREKPDEVIEMIVSWLAQARN